ncbi:MAG: pyrroloquinoline quinone biosynthesis peptide chaperone PqqD [Gammaproteobacteria bacterium]|nr:pyrroloquinoline quinone biosynthesis peptide chaperone PqqD [Gammaproteobacteria bacterium]
MTADAVAPTQVPSLSPMYLFRWEEPQQAHVLLYPEGVVKLNETAAAILALCDGHRSAADIAATLSERYEANVAPGVYRFLEVSYAKGWIRTDP